MIDRTLTAWPDAPGDLPRPEDRPVLVHQLGYLRYEPVRVLRRCPVGYPQIVLAFFGPGSKATGRPQLAADEVGVRGGAPVHTPGLPGEVSTNVFWVTSPYLRLGVDRLEARGTARELKEWVLADPARAARLHEDQLAYHALVARLFAAWLERPPPRAGVFGIGGVRALDQVKCLHAHLACHLATGRSIVGARVEELLRTELAPDFLCKEERCPGLAS